MYDIDRKTASRLLKVSVRTIDRYITSNRVSIQKRDGRIWLNKKEVLKFRERVHGYRYVDTSRHEMSIDKIDVVPVDMSIDNDDTVYSADQNNEEESQKTPLRSPRSHARGGDNSVYKQLFEQLQLELKQKQERLEMANYRVGQLVASLKETVPLLDYNRALATEKAEKDQLRQNLDSQHMELEQLADNFKEERFNKRLYLILLFILLLLQPLWFLFPLK